MEEARARAAAAGVSRQSQPSHHTDISKPKRKLAAVSPAELEKALALATTATDVLSALGQLLLARARRLSARHLVPTPAALHAVRMQVPADVVASIGTADVLISFTVMEAGLALYVRTFEIEFKA